MREARTTHAKALEVNLDPRRYGSIAEIGAGQEVGRWFFRVGAAAGTIAKTMSAYDKEVSDAIYGTAARYVSSTRLQAMLDHEYDLLLERLDATRGDHSAFFAFADTVSAQTFAGDANCHGWMGIRFQTDSRAEPSQIILHARMLDRDAWMQHEALGILGVNLIHGASTQWRDPETLIRGLLDNLGARRLEIDMVEFSGAAFREIDHRVTSLRLVEFGLSRAAMLSATGDVLRASELLYKKSVILQRGRFRPPTIVHADMQLRAAESLESDFGVDPTQVVSIFEIAIKELQETRGPGLKDFLDRVEALNAGGNLVLISDFQEHFLVADYLARYSARQIILPVNAVEFVDLMTESRYAGLPGGLLEATGRLFRIGVRIYVYPGFDAKADRRLELDWIELPEGPSDLLAFLLAKGYIRGLEGLSDDRLCMRSEDVRKLLESGDSRWEEFVEPAVVSAIKSAGLFGYRG
jgi:hypothetical protein